MTARGVHDRTASSPLPTLKLWKGYWESIGGTPSTIPNQGTVGSAIDATVTGMKRVEGPAVWGASAGDFNVLRSPTIGTTVATTYTEMICKATLFPGTPFEMMGRGHGQSGGFTLYYNNGANTMSAAVDTVAAGGITFLNIGPPNLSIGVPRWYRCRHTVATGRTEVWDSPDGTTWTSCGFGTAGASVLRTPVQGYIQLLLCNLGLGTGSNGAIHWASWNQDGTILTTFDASLMLNDTTAYGGWTIFRKTTPGDSALVVVPSGRTVYINPRDTDAATIVSVPDHSTTFDLVHDFAYFNITGAAGNYMQIPHEVNFNITGDIEITCRMTIPQDGVNRKLIQKGPLAGQFNLNMNGGVIYFSAEIAGVNRYNDDAYYPSGWTPGESRWLKVTRTTAGVYNWYVAADNDIEPTSWGAAVRTFTSSNTGAITSNSNDVFVGSGNGGVDPYLGKIYRLIIRNGIGGAVRLNVGGPDIPTDVNAASFVCTSGQTVTLTKSVTNPMTIVPRTGEDAVMVWVGQRGNISATTNPTLFGNRAGGFHVDVDNSGDKYYSQIGGAAPFPTAGSSTKYSPAVVFGIIDRTAQTLTTRVFDENGVQGAVNSGSLLTVGRTINSGIVQSMQYQGGSLIAMAFHSGVGIAPTAAQCADIARQLLRRYV